MRKASTELSQSRGLKRRPLLRTSSPLKPKINRGLTFGVVQQMGARHWHRWDAQTCHKNPIALLGRLPGFATRFLRGLYFMSIS